MTAELMLWAGAGGCALIYLFLAAQPPGLLRSVLKTASVALLAVAALLADAPLLLALALALCALGDLFLSRDGEAAFMAGVGAFAAGHLAYAVLFLTREASDAARLLQMPGAAFAAGLLVLGLMMAKILAPRAGALKGAVLGYIPIILGMGAAALTLPFGSWVFAAACAFMLSDMVLAAETFVLPEDHALRRITPYTVWPLYWGGASGLCGGIFLISAARCALHSAEIRIRWGADPFAETKMAFFSKLKERLFKSSSKLEQGLDAIVEEGAESGAAEAAETQAEAHVEALAESPAVTPEQPAPAPVPQPEPVAEPEPSPEPAPAPQPVAAPNPVPAPEPEKKSPGLLGRLMGRSAAAEPRRALDDDMLEQLEELLIAADMGVDTALRVTANLAEGRMGKKVSSREIKELLAQEVARIMEPVAKPLPIYAKRPQVVLVVGVNGSGKTTTIGKLASQFKGAGKKVVIAAGDTFRAAAVEQLQVWGDRAGVPVLTAPEGSDPASLAFDAMTKAQEDGADLLMIDTAGRLQNRADLMEELAKIVRVIRKKDETAPHNTLLVLDATTGQNALSQVGTFQQLADVSGLVMTKLDGTAKGGVLVALADKFGLPIHAIGVGEQIDDLAPFDPEEFAAALTGLEKS
ncbi:signal recognition particle-docking protein FtsY [Leisingera sp. ANG59]|nr:signal recognition particle-docking protein FtsY [Leisingera sp. ANG59]